MPIDAITQTVSDRCARVAATGEQMCCPTSYDLADLKSFIPDEVLKISYGCGTPAGLQTVRSGETVLDMGEVVIVAAGRGISGDQLVAVHGDDHFDPGP